LRGLRARDFRRLWRLGRSIGLQAGHGTYVDGLRAILLLDDRYITPRWYHAAATPVSCEHGLAVIDGREDAMLCRSMQRSGLWKWRTLEFVLLRRGRRWNGYCGLLRMFLLLLLLLLLHVVIPLLLLLHRRTRRRPRHIPQLPLLILRKPNRRITPIGRLHVTRRPAPRRVFLIVHPVGIVLIPVRPPRSHRTRLTNPGGERTSGDSVTVFALRRPPRDAGSAD
jgi:hypothetical protein